ncbi:MAG: hypothetical protein WB785_12055, partial [Mycobacterium sp.]
MNTAVLGEPGHIYDATVERACFDEPIPLAQAPDFRLTMNERDDFLRDRQGRVGPGTHAGPPTRPPQPPADGPRPPQPPADGPR